MSRHLSTILKLLVAMGTSMASGCAIPYAYVWAKRTPPVYLGSPVAEVTAYRMDYRASLCIPDSMFVQRPISNAHIVPIECKLACPQITAQSRLVFAHGLYLFMVALNHDFRTDDYLELHLYRRGYRTIVLDERYTGAPLEWVRAVTFAEREAAVDHMGTLGRSSRDKPVAVEVLTPIGNSTGQSISVLRKFLVREYRLLEVDETVAFEDKSRISRKIAVLASTATTR